MYNIIIAFVVLSSCNSNWNEQYDSSIATYIHKNLKTKLPKLKPVDFQNILGKIPSKRELELGRQLFNDTILSRNNDVSCATCHLGNHGFADGNSLIVGTLGRGGPNGNNVGRIFPYEKLSVDRTTGDDSFGHHGNSFMFRNSLSTINVAYRHNKMTNKGLFWDGRFGDLFFQVLLPIHTPEEMCGTNPVVKNTDGNNIFSSAGPIFSKSGPITITHTHATDSRTGRDLGHFNNKKLTIREIPLKRPDGNFLVPDRNECLALALAKLHMVDYYKKTFEKIYPDGVTDTNLARALASFVFTHVSKDTPYDRFLKGENSLNNQQMLGLVSYFSPLGKNIKIAGKKIMGGGCISCHGGATFGGKDFTSLGVRSDNRSSLSRPSFVFSGSGGFFDRPRLQRGLLPKCHIKGFSVSDDNNYAPDIGFAGASFKTDDCFKFRIPPLRNVLDTFPYFHHGSENAKGFYSKDYQEIAIESLKRVVKYHLRGPINFDLYKINPFKPFIDPLRQVDPYVPFFSQNFVDYKKNSSNLGNISFPIKISDETINALVAFIAFGLRDKKATIRGALNNDVTHPKRVASGFYPSITRDNGHQLELPK